MLRNQVDRDIYAFGLLVSLLFVRATDVCTSNAARKSTTSKSSYSGPGLPIKYLFLTNRSL